MADTVNDELVSQFLAVTGTADPANATSYLEMSGGNMETAVSLYMDHQGGGGGGLGGGAAAAGGGDPFAAAAEAEIRAPDATRTMRLMDDNMMQQDPSFQLMNAMMEEQLAQSAFAAPAAASRPSDVRAAVNAAAARRSRSHSDDDDEDDENYQAMDAEDAAAGDDDDDDDDVQVVGPNGGAAAAQPAGLSDMFAPPNHLIHRAGGFQGARAMAKDTKRWLLVNIQKDAEFSSHALNRDVWRDELVENLIREGFIFWQQMDLHPEGRTYVERYQVADYPHVGIIDPRTGRLMWRKEGWTMQNPLTAESFSEMAMDFCSRNSFDRPPQAPRPSAAAAASRPSAKRPMHEMSEEEQLQAAMRASMQDSKGDDDDGNNSIEYDDDSDDDDVAVVVAGQGNAKKQEAIKEEPPAPKVSPNEKLVAMDIGDEPAAGARIQFRMPDGKRVVRKFDSSVIVKTIYAFVAQSNEEARGGKEFVLMAGFPPADLVADIDRTIEECKLSGQSINVRWKD